MKLKNKISFNYKSFAGCLKIIQLKSLYRFSLYPIQIIKKPCRNNEKSKCLRFEFEKNFMSANTAIKKKKTCELLKKQFAS